MSGEEELRGEGQENQRAKRTYSKHTSVAGHAASPVALPEEHLFIFSAEIARFRKGVKGCKARLKLLSRVSASLYHGRSRDFATSRGFTSLHFERPTWAWRWRIPYMRVYEGHLHAVSPIVTAHCSVFEPCISVYVCGRRSNRHGRRCLQFEVIPCRLISQVA